MAHSPSGNLLSRDFLTLRSAGGSRSALAFWAHPRVPTFSRLRWMDSRQTPWAVRLAAYRNLHLLLNMAPSIQPVPMQNNGTRSGKGGHWPPGPRQGDFAPTVKIVPDERPFRKLLKGYRSRPIVLPAFANAIASPVHVYLLDGKAVLAARHTPPLLPSRCTLTYSKAIYASRARITGRPFPPKASPSATAAASCHAPTRPSIRSSTET